MGYTYYGDLLGTSGYYRLSPQIAYERLHDFYNITFSSLENYCTTRNDIQVNMLSDSLLIWGNDPEEILTELHKVYTELIHKGLLLRGALVKGKLEFDPRLTIDNFRKMLPKKDTLVRAVGLEQTQKGARLLIENHLARELLNHQPAWMTHEGYIRNILPSVPYDSILRRICPTPDNKTYELLYFWICSDSLEDCDTDYRTKKKELKEIASMLESEIADHYKETIELLKRCQHRQQFTKKSRKRAIQNGGEIFRRTD